MLCGHKFVGLIFLEKNTIELASYFVIKSVNCCYVDTLLHIQAINANVLSLLKCLTIQKRSVAVQLLDNKKYIIK